MNGNQFDDRLSRITELNDDELTALEDEMVAAFDEADTAGDIDQMQQLADALDGVRAEKANREGAPAEEAAVPEEMPAAEPAVAASAESEGDGESDQPTPDEPETPAPDAPGEDEAPAEGDAPATPEAPADPAEPAPDADAEPVPPETEPEEEGAVKPTAADVPADNQPVTASAAPNYTITAGGDIPTITAGSTLDGMDSVVDALTKKINGMRGVSGDGERVIVASLARDIEEEYGEDRILRRGDSDGNSAKIRKLMSENDSVESLVAAGWCAPKTPLYDIPGIGDTATPVADSLASFGVDRGGIIWTEPPSLGGMSSLLANLGVWMNTADEGDDPVWQFVPGADGAGTPAADKPCIDIPCGTEHSAELLAVPLCLCFDNLMSRANPELVKASTDLVLVGQARFKEQWLMAQMFGAPGVVNTGVIGTPDTSLGIARDWLVTLRLAASQFRWRNRISQTTQLQVYAPAWLRDAIASDLMIQMPGDDTMDVSYAEINGYLASINVTPVWFLDDVPAGIGTAAVNATSNFDSYMGYGTPAQWLLTLPGVFTRLDGGTLDLGVVRTKEDVQRNRFCEFAETFEGVAYMGPTTAANAWALRGTTPVTIRGGFAPAVASLTNMAAE